MVFEKEKKHEILFRASIAGMAREPRDVIK